VAKFEYKATKATELSFHKGDTIVEVRKMAGEWWRGSCNGQRGYFPKSYVAVVGEGVIEAQRGNVFHSEKPPLARAMFDFVGQSEQELTFKEGDVIGQVNEGADKTSPWWQGTRGGRTGYFPREYVALVDQKRRKTPYTANVVYRFDARDPKSQLSLAVGEMIEVLELCDEITGGWWVGRKGDKVGYFPANYARYTAKTCEKCQTRAAKAKVTMGPQRTVHWFCRPCVQSMDASARPPKAAAAAAAAKPPAAAASQPIAAATKAAPPAAAGVATSPTRAAAAAPRARANASCRGRIAAGTSCGAGASRQRCRVGATCGAWHGAQGGNAKGRRVACSVATGARCSTASRRQASAATGCRWCAAAAAARCWWRRGSAAAAAGRRRRRRATVATVVEQ
jgi:pyruvate/2-oxoglutarate dehydrogenase complex dihydrolipoamide acyltransferase (E2) component